MSLQRRRVSGFTLIEMVFVIVIMGIMSVVIGDILFQGYQTLNTSKNISEASWQGFIALERMANDIHTIRSAGNISTVTSSQFAFVDVNGTTVTYQLSGTSLLRNSQILASGVQSLSFSYLNANGSTTATASQVRYITVSLTLTQGPMSLAMSTLVGTRGMS